MKNPPANAGDIEDAGSIPGSGVFPGGGLGNPLQCSCLENPMDSGAWRTTVYRVTKSRAQLKQLNTHTHTHTHTHVCFSYGVVDSQRVKAEFPDSQPPRTPLNKHLFLSFPLSQGKWHNSVLLSLLRH